MKHSLRKLNCSKDLAFSKKKNYGAKGEETECLEAYVAIRKEAEKQKVLTNSDFLHKNNNTPGSK